MFQISVARPRRRVQTTLNTYHNITYVSFTPWHGKRFNTLADKRCHHNQVTFHLSPAMLFLLFIYYLVQGVSINATPNSSIDNLSLDTNHCSDLTHCRTIWNMVWSCLVTIFSCTWVAVHPNIPCPKTRKANSCIERWIWNPLLSFAEHRLPLFVCALLVPEYVLGWAVRQFWRARQIVDENKCEFEILGHVFINSLLDRRWSMAHGFFIIMGGLHLFKHNSEEKCDAQSISPEDDDPLHPLLAEDLIRDSIYSFTMLTEAEIKDKGKSDWLAKSLVLLQTSWFVMQCTDRKSTRLNSSHRR